MDVGRLTLTARQQSNSKWELSRAAVNSEPYHEALFFVTAAALQCHLSTNYTILRQEGFDPFIFFYQTSANLNTAVAQCHR